MKYKEYKIKIGDNPSLSKAVQNKAFELGYGWNKGGKIVQLTHFNYLFFKENGKFICDCIKKVFKENKGEKISIRDFFKLTKDDVIKACTGEIQAQQLKKAGLVPVVIELQETIEAQAKEIALLNLRIKQIASASNSIIKVHGDLA